MSRRKAYVEEYQNHERWLVSYADFITLLFAFFVVMYSVSSVNEGKYRVLSNTLDGAFNGEARSMEAIEIGDILQNKTLIEKLIQTDEQTAHSSTELFSEKEPQHAVEVVDQKIEGQQKIDESVVLDKLKENLALSLSPLIDRDLVAVEKNDLWVEVEINSSMLFGSGDATLSDEALRVLWSVAKPIRKLSNQVQVEGFTDNKPINTFEYPSNWELSAARAASVVHLFSKYGIEPKRLSAVGYGEFHPIETNETKEGRDRNRRVVIVIQSNAISRFSNPNPDVEPQVAIPTQPAADLLQDNISDINETKNAPIMIKNDPVINKGEQMKKLERAKQSRFNQFLRR